MSTEDMRQAIQQSSLDTTIIERLIESVEAMQAAAGTKTFADRYKEFTAIAADHLALLAPFFPALAQLLT